MFEFPVLDTSQLERLIEPLPGDFQVYASNGQPVIGVQRIGDKTMLILGDDG